MTPNTMSAVRAYGTGPGALTFERVPVPKAGPGEVLVAVHATAVTAGEFEPSDSWPIIPAHDLSGVVAEVGDGVTDLRLGRRGVRAHRLRPARRRGGVRRRTRRRSRRSDRRPWTTSPPRPFRWPASLRGRLWSTTPRFARANTCWFTAGRRRRDLRRAGRRPLWCDGHRHRLATRPGLCGGPRSQCGDRLRRPIRELRERRRRGHRHGRRRDAQALVAGWYDPVGSSLAWPILRPPRTVPPTPYEASTSSSSLRGASSPSWPALSTSVRCGLSSAGVFPLADTAVALTTQRDEHVRGKVVIEVSRPDAPRPPTSGRPSAMRR